MRAAMLEGIAPVRPFQTKEEYIYRALQDAILQCKVLPGEKLIIDRLTAVFGTSAIPIRSALQRLQAEGLVKIVPHAGAVVSNISLDMVEEIFAILEALESIAFQFAAEKVQDSDLAELEKSVELMEQACRDGDIDGWSDLNGDFHCKVAEMANMGLLLDFTKRAFNYWKRIRRYYLQEIITDILTAQVEHHEMLRLLRQRRGKDLVALVARHNRQSRDYYMKVVQSGAGDPSSQ